MHNIYILIFLHLSPLRSLSPSPRMPSLSLFALTIVGANIATTKITTRRLMMVMVSYVVVAVLPPTRWQRMQRQQCLLLSLLCLLQRQRQTMAAVDTAMTILADVGVVVVGIFPPKTTNMETATTTRKMVYNALSSSLLSPFTIETTNSDTGNN